MALAFQQTQAGVRAARAERMAHPIVMRAPRPGGTMIWILAAFIAGVGFFWVKVRRQRKAGPASS